MVACLIQIDGYDPVTAAAVTLRAASHDDDRVCHLDDKLWWPAIAQLPKLANDNFDGDFGEQVKAPSATLRLAVASWPDFGRYVLADARIRLWTGIVGGAWNQWTLRVDSRLSKQPRQSAGMATISFGPDVRWLDAPLLNTYAGTGGAEGPEELKGTVKPFILGAPRYVTGVLVDPIKTVFQLSAYGPIEAVEGALDGLSRFGLPVGNYPSYEALAAASIPAGSWATARAVGMARHGAPPYDQITYMARGDRAGPDGWARLPGDIIRRIALLSGGADRIQDSALNALNLARPWNLSIAIAEQTTARDVIRRIAASVNAVAGVNWLGKLYVVPVDIGISSLELHTDGTALPPVEAVEQMEAESPAWRLAIQAERTWTVHPQSAVQYVQPPEPGATVGATAAQLQVLSNALDAAEAAKAIADGKIETFYQQEPPTGTFGDLWFDTNDGNRLYRHNGGSWEAARDSGIGDAITAAAGAQATADGKVTTFTGEGTPTAEGVGDLWYRPSDASFRRWDGDSWDVVSTVGAPLGTKIGDKQVATVLSDIVTNAQNTADLSGVVGAYRIANDNLTHANDGTTVKYQTEQIGIKTSDMDLFVKSMVEIDPVTRTAKAINIVNADGIIVGQEFMAGPGGGIAGWMADIFVFFDTNGGNPIQILRYEDGTWKMPSVEINRLKVGSVSTLSVEDNAITDALQASNASLITLSPSTWTELVAFDVPMLFGGRISIDATLIFTFSTGGSWEYRMILSSGGVDTIVQSNSGNIDHHVPVLAFASVGPGLYRVRIEAFGTGVTINPANAAQRVTRAYK